MQKVVGEVQSRGLRLRSRLPEDKSDWTVGVEAFDVLAILRGRTFDPETSWLLLAQQDRIHQSHSQFRKRLRQAIVNEQKWRRQRHDSVTNYLEPNLKYGPGGLRDLQQALDLHALFSSRFKTAGIDHQLAENKQFFLSLRQRLHLLDGTDILSGAWQIELAKFFGAKDAQEFMRDVQSRLSQVSFYVDWVIAQSAATQVKLKKVAATRITTRKSALEALQKDESVLMQAHIRQTKWSDNKPEPAWTDYFDIKQSEGFFGALFGSQLIDHFVPDVARVRGLVQHDHYHRFTLDAHLLQTIREVKRLYDRPKKLGKLAPWVRHLDKSDCKILLWTALYHDLAKGKGGDHSTKGAELVHKDFKLHRLPASLADEVAWMVQNHLILSTAAFRMNVQEPSTWQFVHARGAKGRRLVRLAIFTAIDILSTNPEAWTEWKERLLADLLSIFSKEQTQEFLHLLSSHPAISADLLAELDPSLVGAVPQKQLVDDFRKLKRDTKNLSNVVLRNRKGETWVRFHRREDRPGLFLNFVTQLYAIGVSIQQSSVRTLNEHGAYDWFQVRTKKNPAQILRQLELIEGSTQIPVPNVQFQQIEVISQVNDTTILSFRGRDQKGLLLSAAQALFESQLVIRWAKVHTWGSQIDDIFCVKTPANLDELLGQMRQKLRVADRH